MKRLFLFITILLMSTQCYGQCVAEIKNVVQDELRGSIIVETEYKLNGKVVQQGKTRYTEESGTNEEIIAKAKEDVALHCENIIRRIAENEAYRNTESLKAQKELTAPIITSIKSELVGHTTTKTEAVDTFKGKEIKVTYDKKNTISDITAERK